MSRDLLKFDVVGMSITEIVERNYDKRYWEEAIQRLMNYELNEILSVVSELFKWLQDLNWPGAMKIMDLLVTLPRKELFHYLERSIILARIEEDMEWIVNLSLFMKWKYIEFSMKDFKDPQVYTILLELKGEYR